MSAGNHEQEEEPVTRKVYTAFEARYAMPSTAKAVFSAITIQPASSQLTAVPKQVSGFKCQSSVFNSGYDYGNSFYSFNAGTFLPNLAI